MKNKSELLEIIDSVLPQTQCGKCGYNSCKPYAEAITNGIAEINLCPPGGSDVISSLAKILNKKVIPLDKSKKIFNGFKTAKIDENECIGCTICINKCPVDAIIGAPKKMHSVVTEWCTGCELCIEPCPVDCIKMISTNKEWSKQDADKARKRKINNQERQKQKISMDISLEIFEDKKECKKEERKIVINQNKSELIKEIIKKAKERRNR